MKKLIAAESTPRRGELECAQVLAEFFERAGFRAIVDSWDRNRANLTAELDTGKDGPGLLVASHLDVVPAGDGQWKSEPFVPVERDGKVFGRGAADMKAGIATSAAAAVEAVKGGDICGRVIFAAVAGEETDSAGAKRFIDRTGAGIGRLCGVLVPEPTDFEIITSHRGILWVNFTTFGRTAHGSMPHLGVNAIESMHLLISALKEMPLPELKDELLGGCSMSINQVRGGEAPNVVPDSCTLTVDLRTVPGVEAEDILQRTRGLIDGLAAKHSDFKAGIDVLRHVPPMQTDPGCDFVVKLLEATGQKDTKAVGFTTDGPYFAKLGAPVAVFGPGLPCTCHKPDEYIDIDDIDRAVVYYREIIEKTLI